MEKNAAMAYSNPGPWPVLVPNHHSPKRALVVDDDPGMLEILSFFFQHLGIDTSRAPNGQAAFDIFQRAYFDLVLTDIQMPKMNGLTLMKNIKAKNPKTPVILSTGLTAQEVAQYDGAKLASAVLHKPYPLAKLKQSLNSVFGIINE